MSVVLPVYNVAPYLRKSLETLTNQTLKEIEIVCVDDASTDGSKEILEEFASRDKRIKLLFHEKNLGIGAARNDGARIATGEYMIHLDPDDFFEYEMLMLMYQKAKSFDINIDVVVCDYYKYDSQTHTSVRPRSKI